MQEQKTVLYIHHSSTMGGAPRSLALLIGEIDRDRWIPFVLTPRDGEVAQSFRDAGASVIVDPRIRLFPGSDSPVNSPLRLVWAWRQGRQTELAADEHVRVLKPAVIHLNSTSLCMAARGARRAAPNARIVCHARETLARGMGSKIIRSMNHHYCDIFIALDRDGLARLNAEGKEAVVVNNFVDTSRFASYPHAPILKKQHGLSEADVVLVFLARIISLNGVLEAVRMIRLLPAEFSHVHFFFFGYDSGSKSVACKDGLAEQCRAIAKRWYRRVMPTYLERVRSVAQEVHNIHVLPFQRDILPILGSADILFCPFSKAHFARSIVEAAAMGIPSLASNVPSLRTLVEHGKTGWLYDVTSQSSFEEGLRVLALDPARRAQIGKAASKRSLLCFDVSRNAQITFSTYNR